MKSTSLFFGFTSSHRVEPCFLLSFSGHDTAYPVLANYDFPKFCDLHSLFVILVVSYPHSPLIIKSIPYPPPPPMQDWQALQITELLASTELPQFSVHQILQQTAQDIVSAKHLQYNIDCHYPSQYLLFVISIL